ncbi:hypothetical protein G6F43_007250 [Rhizopus delemar]|nr:hypothetical protein G6F43_007250 [Rhizopus delemar]
MIDNLDHQKLIIGSSLKPGIGPFENVALRPSACMLRCVPIAMVVTVTLLSPFWMSRPPMTPSTVVSYDNPCSLLLLLSVVLLLSNFFDDVSVSVLLQNNVSTPFSLSTGVLQDSVLSPHLYFIYINTLPVLLHSDASSSTTLVLTLSPFGPPGPESMVPPDLPFGPSLSPSSSSPLPSPTKCLFYAEDVALVGSARKVWHMLDLAQIHSLMLGYSYARPSLYGEDLPSVDELIYFDVPFDPYELSVPTTIKHRSSSSLMIMAQLSTMSLNRNGFPLLFFSRIYAAFAQPKIEYGLAMLIVLKRTTMSLPILI